MYRESGGGWRGALDAFNRVWNPGFQILAAGDSCLTGYGTSNGWGRGTSCASAAVQIGLFVAAPVAGKALTAAIGGRGAATAGLRLSSSAEMSGVERASPELIEAVSAKRTVRFATAGSDELRYLDHMNAEANVGGADLTHVLLRENPSKSAVLEEFLHGTQARLGIVDRLGPAGAEAHVKDFMIRHSQMLGLGEEDVSVLQELLGAGL